MNWENIRFKSDYAPGTQYEHAEGLIIAGLDAIMRIALGMGLPGTAQAIGWLSKSVLLGKQEELLDIMRRFVTEASIELQEKHKHQMGAGLLASWEVGDEETIQ